VAVLAGAKIDDIVSEIETEKTVVEAANTISKEKTRFMLLLFNS